MAEIKLKTNSNPHIDLSDSSSNASINISSDSNSPHIAMNDMPLTPAIETSNIVPTKLLGVKDVLVDGASVVSDNVANIVLAPVCFTGDYDDLIDKPTNVSAFINDAGYLIVETDPTVPSWAKEESKPSYTASEIGGLIDMFYPVGSYYETSDEDFDPNEAWGGTWELDSAGRVTVAVDPDSDDGKFASIGETGGSKYIQAHTHGFTQPKIPNHQHSMNTLWSDGSGSSSAYTMSSSRKLTTRNTANDGGGGSCTGGSVGAVSGATTGSEGNLQPYIVVNRWHRTA